MLNRDGIYDEPRTRKGGFTMNKTLIILVLGLALSLGISLAHLNRANNKLEIMQKNSQFQRNTINSLFKNCGGLNE